MCRAYEICENILDPCDLKKMIDLKEELLVLTSNSKDSLGMQLYF